MALIPPIGTSGIFQLSAPFADQLVNGATYTCVAIRRIADIVHSGFDPYELYYQPYGLARTTYDGNVTPDACIVSLVSAGGAWLYVPSAYILSYPNIGGASYTSIVLGIDLGPIPDHLNLSYIKQSIIDMVRDNIGVSSTVTSVAVSDTKLLAPDVAASLEASRQANIINSTTDHAKYLAAVAQRDALQIKLTAAENYIKLHIPP